MRIHWVSSLILSVCTPLLADGGPSYMNDVISGATMGTSYRVVIEEEYLGWEPDPKKQLREAIDARLSDIEDMMSTWRPDSELSRFNRSPSTDWFPVSKDVVVVVAEAKRIWELSEGAFDPTVAPLIRLWHFAEEPGDKDLPPDTDIEAAKANSGMQGIEFRHAPPALRKQNPALELNLSAIAKGFAVDVISDLVATHGFRDHLVEIGGEMRARGSKHRGQQSAPWVAGIERPDAWPRDLFATLPLEDGQSIATSGDYRNFFEVDGQRYSHTIDPMTGRPVTHQLASVTVLAPTCMTADALATAIEVLGPERGLKLATDHSIPALLTSRTADGFSEQSTRNFPEFTLVDTPEQRVSPSDPAAKQTRNPVLATVLAAAGLFALAVAGMAVGVIFSNRCIQGSCGGLANMPGGDGKSACELCTVPADECRDEAMRNIKQQARNQEDTASS